MLMQDVPVGSIVYLLEQLDLEVRETFYLRTANGNALYGCIQGTEIDEPRVVRLRKEPIEYPLVPRLPVRSLAQSSFRRRFVEAVS